MFRYFFCSFEIDLDLEVEELEEDDDDDCWYPEAPLPSLRI
jgi:hypothetical protein